jgi:CheY-like chemotaxis protein
MLLEDAEAPEFTHRRVQLEHALVAVREATSLIDGGLPPTAASIDKDRIQSLYEALHHPQSRIIDAMSRLLHDEVSAPAEFVADVCRIRDAAERLLPTDRPRAEMTGTFAIPVAVTVAPQQAPGSRTGRAAHILVVDDVEENRGVLQRRLNREGHSVVCAANGHEALAEVGKASFDMVLLDVMMPDMDGYETLQHLKSSPATHDIPVIMISALDDIASIVRCIEQGAEDYLPKPFDPVLLRARISASLEKKDARDRERQFLHDVSIVSAAAVAVERGSYSGGALHSVAQRDDELGALARVFDNMVAGIRMREARMRDQIDSLRKEIAGVSDAPVDAADSVHAVLSVGDRIAERYVVERAVGSGGMGMVYLAKDLELDEHVAIKTLRPELLTDDETAIERFRNEIRLARRIAHRNIVRTHDFGKAGSMYFVTMEFVEGTTLRAVLDRRGHLGAPAVLAIAKQLAEALRCAHEEGIIHRDIKPQNLLLDAAGTLKVMDFGVARLAQRTSALTQVGMVVGTPTYMAPEQLLDEESDARSDLYSAGVLLYECLTGAPPYEARSPIALIGKILQGGAASPDARVADVPKPVAAVVMQLLAKDPAERIQSAAALTEVLAGIA